MPTQVEYMMALLKDGKIVEARALLESEKTNSRYAPDTVETVNGKPPRFTKNGRSVVVGNDGKWRLKK